MTRPRLYPDRPRMCADTKAWALEARKAGASVWQVAVFTQREPDTLYKLFQRTFGKRRKRHVPGRSVRDVNKRLRAMLARDLVGQMFRCHCGGVSTKRGGHDSCRVAA